MVRFKKSCLQLGFMEDPVEEEVRKGSFQDGDEPEKILFVKLWDQTKEFFAKIQWKEKDGKQPLPRVVRFEEAKKYCPLLVLDYLESKIMLK